MHDAGIGDAIIDSEILGGHPDGEVGEAVPIEIPGGQGGAEDVARFGQFPYNAREVLKPELIAHGAEAIGGPAVDHVDCAGTRVARNGLAGHPDGEVIEAVAVEVGTYLDRGLRRG